MKLLKIGQKHIVKLKVKAKKVIHDVNWFLLESIKEWGNDNFDIPTFEHPIKNKIIPSSKTRQKMMSSEEDLVKFEDQEWTGLHISSFLSQSMTLVIEQIIELELSPKETGLNPSQNPPFDSQPYKNVGQAIESRSNAFIF